MSTTSQAWEHLPSVHPLLRKHLSHLLPPPAKYRMLVPLCGKTLDMHWLHEQGHSVFGVEANEDLVKSFFEENSIEHSVQDLEWSTVYMTPDRRLQVFVMDVLSPGMDKLGQFDAVWDRAAMSMVADQNRDRYAHVIKRLLRPHFRYLVNAVMYRPAENYEGPPYNLPNYVLHQHFGDIAVWKVIDSVERMTKDELEANNLQIFRESLIMLSPKGL